MRSTTESTVVIRPQELRLKRRSNSGAWQIHYKIGSRKTWYRVTSKTANLSEAKTIAEDIFHEARVLEKRGLSIVSKKFKAVAEVVSTSFKEQVKAGTGKKSYADYYRAIDTYLIPFFGNYHIDNITPALIAEFHRWRTEKVGYELKASTQNNHNAALNSVFDHAIEKGYMSESQRSSTKNTGQATEARGIFSTDELIELQQFIHKWTADGRATKTRYLRELLGLYITFIACTGVRPGTETKELKWKHIEFIQKPSMRVIHITLPQGKRGSRQLIARNELWPLLDKLRELQPEYQDITLEQLIERKENRHIFLMRDGTMPYNLVNAFGDCLKESELDKGDKDGRSRSLYSLRHYYATQRILEGYTYEELEAQMGTSADMLQKHYNHLSVLMIADRLAGKAPNSQGQNTQDSEILKYMNPAKSNMMGLIALTTGIYIPLQEQNPSAAKELSKELLVTSKRKV